MKEPNGRLRGRAAAFTLVEVLLAAVVLAVLLALISPAIGWALRAGQAAKSTGNLRQLAAANFSYAADNDGRFCPAQEPRNRTRWHGGRASGGAVFDPAKGFLAPYLGESRRIGICPLFQKLLTGGASFENSTGGYGYNAAYIGGTPANAFRANLVTAVPHPSRTVMFATTALARSDGVQEYPYAEPPNWVDPNGRMGGPLQPSVHFRANGKALVAWCDGRVTAETPAQLGGTEYYGGDSREARIGWFGPSHDNGYWNPDFEL